MSAKEFRLGLEKFGKLSKEQVETLQSVVTLDLTARAITGNPVRTGRSKGGWIPSAGAPSTFVPVGPQAPYSGGLKIKFGTPSFVANNVEYIGHLNDHHPTKAGWVDAAVEQVARQYGLERS